MSNNDFAEQVQQFQAIEQRLIAEQSARMDALAQAQKQWRADQENSIPSEDELYDHLMNRNGFIDDADDPMPQFQRNIIRDHAQQLSNGMASRPLPIAGYYNVDPGHRSADGVWHRSPSKTLRNYGMDHDGLLAKVNAERARRGRPEHNPHTVAQSIADKVSRSNTGTSARYHSAG